MRLPRPTCAAAFRRPGRSWRRSANQPQLSETEPYLAYKALEAYCVKKFYGAISTDLGGGNTAGAIYVVTLLDCYIIDVGPVGSSISELHHSTYFICNLPIYLLAWINKYDDVAILPHVVSDLRNAC